MLLARDLKKRKYKTLGFLINNLYIIHCVDMAFESGLPEKLASGMKCSSGVIKKDSWLAVMRIAIHTPQNSVADMKVNIWSTRQRGEAEVISEMLFWATESSDWLFHSIIVAAVV